MKWSSKSDSENLKLILVLIGGSRIDFDYKIVASFIFKHDFHTQTYCSTPYHGHLSNRVVNSGTIPHSRYSGAQASCYGKSFNSAEHYDDCYRVNSK